MGNRRKRTILYVSALPLSTARATLAGGRKVRISIANFMPRCLWSKTLVVVYGKKTLNRIAKILGGLTLTLVHVVAMALVVALIFLMAFTIDMLYAGL